MNSYLTIFFPYKVYNSNKHKLQNLRIRFNIQWNDKKVREISYGEIIGIYKLFKSEDRIIKDATLNGRRGATGLWSSESDSLKIVAFDSVNEMESPPVLLIYRGVEGEFYKVLVKMCADIGCEIGKLIEDENGMQVIFKKHHTTEEVEKIRNLEDSKKTMLDEFNRRILELKNHGFNSSNEFINEWRKCIDIYGYYKVTSLQKDIRESKDN